MAREVVLKNNPSEMFAQSYPKPLRIYNKDGSFYVTDEDRTEGPYEKVFLSIRGGSFVCGIRGINHEIFTTSSYGIVERNLNELEDEANDLKKLLLDMKVEKELEQLSGCEFLGEVYVYRLEKNPKSPYAKKDGLARILIDDTTRHIFQNGEGKVFSVNPNKPILPQEKYLKADTYEELCLKLVGKNIEYSDLPKPQNAYLERLYKKLRYERVVPPRLVRKIFERLKEERGIEAFRGIDAEVKINISKKNLVDLKELKDALEKISLEHLKQFSHNNNLYRKRGEGLTKAGVDEIEDIIKTLPSTSIIRCIEVCYKDVSFKVITPDDEKTRVALENSELYDWKDGAGFSKDKPRYYDEICQIAERRRMMIIGAFSNEDESENKIQVV